MTYTGSPAEVFPPGEFLREEIEARGWSQADLAEILDRPPRLISEIISGKRAVTPETARGLGKALGTGAEFWLHLESAYQLSRVHNSDDDGVLTRARLFEKAPMKELIRRNWIEPSSSAEVLESRVLNFFEVEHLDEDPQIWPHAARKSTSYSELSPSQLAWLCRARHLAPAVHVAPFRASLFSDTVSQLVNLTDSPEGVRHVPKVLADMGIRFLVIEHLAGTRIDGACIWIDRQSPVVALSLRYDRIDYFWHTLMHEMRHIKNLDGLDNDVVPIDTDMDGGTQEDTKPECEKLADQFAAEQLVPQDRLRDFIDRVGPLYSMQKILAFAKSIPVHPGIVVGQLHHRKELPYSHGRKFLVKVRRIVTQAALTDGWGHIPPATLA